MYRSIYSIFTESPGFLDGTRGLFTTAPERFLSGARSSADWPGPGHRKVGGNYETIEAFGNYEATDRDTQDYEETVKDTQV